MQHVILHLKTPKLSKDVNKIKIKSVRKTVKRWPYLEIAIGLAVQIKWKVKAKRWITSINAQIKLKHKKQG